MRTSTSSDREPSGRFHLPDGSRSVQSRWVWRGFAFMSLIALGLCITFAVGGQTFYAGAWGVITAAWFAVAMWLWRQHVRYDDYIYAQERLKKGSGRAKRG